jgi:hypothetical protein
MKVAKPAGTQLSIAGEGFNNQDKVLPMPRMEQSKESFSPIFADKRVLINDYFFSANSLSF